MKPEHVLMWVEARIAHHTDKAEESRKLFAAEKARKEATWYYRLFRAKYEYDWMDWWTFPHHEGAIRQYEELRKGAEYCHKMKYKVMTLPKDYNDWDANFYRWADKNNIPY